MAIQTPAQPAKAMFLAAAVALLLAGCAQHGGRRDHHIPFGLYSEDVPYEHISLERRGCFSKCPVFVVTFHGNGHATLDAMGFMPQEGRLITEISAFDFVRLAELVYVAREAFSEGEYLGPEDSQQVIIRVGTREGEIVVKGSELALPSELWALATSIDAVRLQSVWRKE